MAQKRDYYEVLEVSRTATVDEISSSYRKLAIRYHPDSNPGDDDAIEKFKEAAEAYEVLSDEQKRARYDHYGHAGVDGAAGGSPHFTNVEDIFEAFSDIFGGGGGFFGDIFGGGRQGRRGPRRGADVKCQVTLTLEEAAAGAKKQVSFERNNLCEECSGSGAAPGAKPQSCPRCNGNGKVVQSAGILRVQTTCPTCAGNGQIITDPCRECSGHGFIGKRVSLDVTIPAGVDDGMRVRIPGEGEPSPEGGAAGDLYCFVVLKEHPLFAREGMHLLLEFPITYAQAALGAALEIPTLNGREELKIPPATQSGDVFRLRGCGVRDPRGRGVGDLHVQTHIEVPKKLSERQEELLRELAEEERTNVSPQRKSFFAKLKDYFVASSDAESEK